MVTAIQRDAMPASTLIRSQCSSRGISSKVCRTQDPPQKDLITELGSLCRTLHFFPHRLCLWPLVQIQDVLALNETAHAACLYDS